MKKPQETLEFKMTRQVETFPFSRPVNPFEETNWQWAVTKFEATNSLSKRTGGNKSFSIATPSYWTLKSVEETIDKLNEILELRFKMILSYMLKILRTEALEENGKQLIKFSSFDPSQREILAEARRAKYKDLEDMVYRMGLTNEEVEDILDKKILQAQLMDIQNHWVKKELVILTWC